MPSTSGCALASGTNADLVPNNPVLTSTHSGRFVWLSRYTFSAVPIFSPFWPSTGCPCSCPVLRSTRAPSGRGLAGTSERGPLQIREDLPKPRETRRGHCRLRVSRVVPQEGRQPARPQPVAAAQHGGALVRA